MITGDWNPRWTRKNRQLTYWLRPPFWWIVVNSPYWIGISGLDLDMGILYDFPPCSCTKGIHFFKGSKGYFDPDKFTCLPDQFLFFACAKPSCLNSWTMSDSPVCWLGVIRQNLFCWSPSGLILVKTIQFQDHKLEFQDHILSFSSFV